MKQLSNSFHDVDADQIDVWKFCFEDKGDLESQAKQGINDLNPLPVSIGLSTIFPGDLPEGFIHLVIRGPDGQ